MNKYNEFAVGWLKQSKNKGEYVSAVASKGNPNAPGGNNPKIKLLAEFEDGTQREITNFAMFFNENKKSEKAPDVRFVFSEE